MKRQKLYLKRGVKRQKLCVKCCIDLSKILYSTPQISERIPFLFSPSSLVCLVVRRTLLCLVLEEEEEEALKTDSINRGPAPLSLSLSLSLALLGSLGKNAGFNKERLEN